MFEQTDGCYFKQLGDCHWIKYSPTGYMSSWFNFVELSEDPIEGKLVKLANNRIQVRLFENKLIWNPNGNTFNISISKGAWKPCDHSKIEQVKSPAAEPMIADDEKTCPPFKKGNLFLIEIFISFSLI